MARRLIGDRAMTGTERWRRWRDRHPSKRLSEENAILRKHLEQSWDVIEAREVEIMKLARVLERMRSKYDGHEA